MRRPLRRAEPAHAIERVPLLYHYPVGSCRVARLRVWNTQVAAVTVTVTVTFLLRRGYAFAGVVRSWPSYAMIRTSSTQAPSFFAAGCRLSRPSTSAESNAGNPVRGARPELLLLRACSGLRRAAIYLAQEVVHATVTLECEASCGGALRLDKVYMHVRSTG